MSDRSAPEAGDSIGRNAVLSFATQLLGAAVTAGLTIYLVRALGPADFGIFSLALSVTGILMRPSGAGTSQAAGRWVAEHHGDHEAVAGVLGLALRIRLLSAGALSLALFALAEPIAAIFGEPELVWPLRGVAVAFFGQGLLLFFRTVFVSMRRSNRAFTLVASESMFEALATVVLVALGGGASGAAFGRAIGYVVGGLIGLAMLTRLLRRSPLFRPGRSPVSRREFAGYAGAMFVVSGASAVFSQLDVLLIGALMSATAVGLYSAPLRLIALSAYPAQALSQGIAPRIARHREEEPRISAWIRGLRYVVITQIAIAVFLTVWSEPIVGLLLGDEFSDSAEVLRALAPFVALSGVVPMLASPLNYAGEGRGRIPVAVASVLVLAGGCLLMIPSLGIVGAAIATDLGYLLYAAVHVRLCHSRLQLPLRPLLRATLRAGLAALPIVAFAWLCGFGAADPWFAALAMVAGLAGFSALIIALGEIDFDELRWMRRQASGALRRGQR